MKSLKSYITLIAMLALAVGTFGCSSDTSSILAPSANDSNQARSLAGGTTDLDDIVDTAIGAEIFTTLVAAVQAAELEEALRAEGPYTVFAPTDDAFANLPEGLVEQLLQPRNKGKLKELLLYHVLGAEVFSTDLRRFQFTETLSGKYLWIRKFSWGTVKVNGARVTTPDVDASNGVIHIIDRVLIPRGFELEPEPATLDIVDTAIGAEVFTTLVAAVQAAELESALRSAGPFTVFAPSDDAFAQLPAELVAALLLPENKSKLQELLLYHVLDGQVLKGDLNFYQRVATKQGSDVRIIKWFGNVWVNSSRVTAADVLATNGVIHVINRVLIPDGFTLETPSMTFTGQSLNAALDSKNAREEMPPTRSEMQSQLQYQNMSN